MATTEQEHERLIGEWHQQQLEREAKRWECIVSDPCGGTASKCFPSADEAAKWGGSYVELYEPGDLIEVRDTFIPLPKTIYTQAELDDAVAAAVRKTKAKCLAIVANIRIVPQPDLDGDDAHITLANIILKIESEVVV